MIRFASALVLATTSAYAAKFGFSIGGGHGLHDKFVGGHGSGGSLASKMNGLGGSSMKGFGGGSKNFSGRFSQGNVGLN